MEYVVSDLLGDWQDVRAKAMFGGYGVYRNGTIFGIIDEDVLYFKVGESSRKDYEAAGSKPFSYRLKNRKKAVVMSYWEVPAQVMDDREEIFKWAERALAVSHGGSKKTR